MINRVQLAHILLVEDSPEDVLLTQEALKDAKVANELHVAKDGHEAMAFLRREPPYEDAVVADLVLLDLNLPGMDGREVLAEMKADPQLQLIPVVVLTTSVSEKDLLHAYDHHVNAYVRKPVNLDRFIEVVKQIDEFWLGVVTLPPVR
jgi:chemotaxis family two-component system response regulator Rcp1